MPPQNCSCWRMYVQMEAPSGCFPLENSHQHLQVTPGFSFGTAPGPLDRHCNPPCAAAGVNCSVDCLFFECQEALDRTMLRETYVVRRKLSDASFDNTCDLQVAGFTRDDLLSSTCDLSPLQHAILQLYHLLCQSRVDVNCSVVRIHSCTRTVCTISENGNCKRLYMKEMNSNF